MLDFPAPPPLTLYVHLPWCLRKCPYCDFNSHQLRGELPERAYVDALLADLEQDLPRAGGRALDSVFFGGGTPSLFSPRSIDRLLEGIRHRLLLAPAAEITLEANPGTLESGKFREFRAAGVNRLSIGVQSFNDDHLRALGRIHGRAEALRAAETAHAAGLDNFNLDLMYGLPGQSEDDALRDLATAVELAPAHVSHYQLTLEPGTAFYKQPPELPADDTLWAMQTRCQALLAEHGYAQYEVSAYARADRRCVHNLNYWQFGDYLGIGAGAHGKHTDPAAGIVYRRAKCKNPRVFLDERKGATRVTSDNPVLAPDLVLEFMLNALRLTDGFATGLFARRTGQTLDVVLPNLQVAQENGLVIMHNNTIRTTELGQRFLNDALQLFMPAD